MNALEKFKEPDFAFPRTVEANAGKLLEKANGMSGLEADRIRLRAVLETVRAKAEVDYDSLYVMPGFVERQCGLASTDAGKALLTAVEIRLLSDGMRRTRISDKTEILPLPADIAEWSAGQYEYRIRELLAVMDSLAASGGNAPLTAFEGCITYNDVSLMYFPDVASFCRLQEWNVYSNSRRVVPFAESEQPFIERVCSVVPEGSAQWFYWKSLDDNIHSDSSFFKLYQKYADNENARLLLVKAMKEMYVDYGSDDTREVYTVIDAAKSSLERFPAWWGNGVIRNELNRIMLPKAEVQVSRFVAPGEFEMKVNTSFLSSLKVNIHRLPNTFRDSYSYDDVRKFPIVKTLVLNDLASDSINVSSSLKTELPAGRYAMVPSFKGCENSRRYDRLVLFSVSPVMISMLSENGTTYFVAQNTLSGEPVEGVGIHLRVYRRQEKIVSVGLTGKDGMLKYDSSKFDGSGRVYYSYKGVNYDPEDIYFHYSSSSVKRASVRRAKIFHDRPVYHPGDSVSWMSIVYESDKESSQYALAGGCKLRAVLKNVNSGIVDSLDLVTDSYGRINGTFVTPAEGLTGACLIEILDGRHTIGVDPVEVSDFKLPKTEVSVTDIRRDFPERGQVQISGVYKTYSGMAVADARISMTVRQAYFPRYFHGAYSDATFDVDGTTDARGAFSLVVPVDSLDVKDGFYTAEITAVSPSGESVKTSRNFSTGKPYILSVEPGIRNVDAAKPFTFTPQAEDANSQKASIAVRWQLRRFVSEKQFATAPVLLSGEAVTGTKVTADLSKLEAGDYRLTISPADTSLADSADGEPFVLYNTAAGLVPADKSMFVPETSLTADAGGKVTVKVGTSYDNAYIIAAYSVDGRLEVECRKIDKGFTDLQFALPDKNGEKRDLTLYTLRNGIYNRVSVTVMEPLDKRTIIAESFRDRLTPGAGERWRFRLSGFGPVPASGLPVVATMFNRALNAINSSYSFGGAFMLPSRGRTLSYSSLSNYWRGASVSARLRRTDEPSLLLPSFMFLNNPVFVENMVMYKSMAVNNYNIASADGITVRGYGTTSGMLEEAAVEEEAESVSEDMGAGGAVPEEAQMNYRVPEVLQAFWKPMLLSDSDGNVDISFVVPDAVGAWDFRAFAWTGDLKAAQYMAECVSSKPVMVQASLPRFLRQGDKAQIRATVFNNSGRADTISSVVEIFDANTGAVLHKYDFSSFVDDGASDMVTVPVEAPTDAAAVGYRVRSSAAGFADGEQSLIPVLSSSSTVVESSEFYVNAGDDKPRTLEMKLRGDENVILQYCANPVWNVVRALRGVSSDEHFTVTGEASALFSTMAAAKIVNDSPSISAVIKEWLSDKDSDALKSRLQQNEDAKLKTLGQTPWLQDAMSQTRRMEAFATVFDSKNVENAFNTSLSRICKAQNNDGGFYWGGWCRESSEWATLNVMTTLGIANSLGMLPKDKTLSKTIDSALKYLDNIDRRNRKTDIQYTLVCALFPSHTPSLAGKRVVDATVSEILSDWKKHSTVSKAYDVLILNANGYEASAKTIISSLRQFGVVRPGMGMSFPSVTDIRGYATLIQAFAQTGASDAELDAMRQWVILQSQVSDNMMAYNPDYVIAAILMTGSVWTDAAPESQITVNGAPLAVDRREAGTGYFSVPLKASKGTLKVTVASNGATPSYGSVTAVGRKPMGEVSARPGKDVAIDKQLLVKRDGKYERADAVQLGQTVTVRLTIKVKRDLQYVTVTDERAAALEPVDQLPGYLYDGGLSFYRENRDASTNIFISYLPAGVYTLTYDMTASTAGSFAGGIATLQSQYAPEITAHSGGAAMTVE